MTINNYRYMANLCLATLIVVTTGGCRLIDTDDDPRTSTTTTTTVNDPGITGFYYAFEDNRAPAIDGSGNDYHGIATSVPVEPGISGNAANFDTGSTIELPAINNLSPFAEAFTFRVWVKIDPDDIVASTKMQIIGGSADAATDNFGLSVIKDASTDEFRFSVDIPSQASIESNDVSVDTDWFMMTVVHNNGTILFYHNLTAAGSGSLPLSMADSFVGGRIGNNLTAAGIENQFIGELDELELFKRQLTGVEMSSYYNSIVGP